MRSKAPGPSKQAEPNAAADGGPLRLSAQLQGFSGRLATGKISRCANSGRVVCMIGHQKLTTIGEALSGDPSGNTQGYISLGQATGFSMSSDKIYKNWGWLEFAKV